MDDSACIMERIVVAIRHATPTAGDVRVVNLQAITGGNARRAWSFELSWEREHKRETLRCILLSQAPGRHVDSDPGAEFAVLKSLEGHGICAPGVIAVDKAGNITGAPSIIMKMIEGDADPIKFLKNSSVETCRALTADLARKAADLHAFDWRGAGLSAVDNPPYQQITEWENIFLENRQEPLPVFCYLFDWLKNNVPEPARLSLVHGDLRVGNFLYLDEQITAILDWEMAHIGDPAEDIAWIYRDLWSPARYLSLDTFLETYTERHGIDPGYKNIVFYRAFGEIKHAIISLTASAAVMNGESNNLRHADRASMAPRCVERCLAFVRSYEEIPNHVAA